MSREDDFQKLIDAIWAERDQGRGVRRALAEHPDLWPLVVDLGLDGYAEEVEEETERAVAQGVAHEGAAADACDDDMPADDDTPADHDAHEAAPMCAMRVGSFSRRSATVTPPGFKPSRGRRTFAGSVVNRPRVVAWSRRAAID